MLKSQCSENSKSSYCDYNETFASYDQIRQPNGAKELLDIFSKSSIPIHKQIVLEGGFGTGAYVDIFRHHVEKIYGIEASEEGLRQAMLKTRDSKNVNLKKGDILDLPFPDNFFDVYMVNQVLHHLDSEPPFSNMDTFLDESQRVLKPQGILTINTCSQEQLDPENGVYWYYKYISPAAHQLRSHYLPIEDLRKRLESMNFAEIKQTIPCGKIYHYEYYEDPEIVLKSDFKKGDSIYSFMSQAEIEESDKIITASIENGSVYDEMKRASERAAEIGETLIVSVGI